MEVIHVCLHLRPFSFTTYLSCPSFDIGFLLFWNLAFTYVLIDSAFICLDLLFLY